MNASVHAQNASDDRWIDRLVDGELTPDERSELLKRLEASPDGWRRCALAFLEAQAWRAAMQPAAVSTATASHPWENGPGEGRAPRRPQILKFSTRTLAWIRPAAVAACLLLAFSLGRMGLDGTPTTSIPAEPQGARPTYASNSARVESAPKPAVLKTGVVEEIPSQSFKVDPKWLATVPSPMPENVRRQLQRRGYEVEQREAFLSMPLEDGRQVSVPVDEFQVRYVGDHSL